MAAKKKPTKDAASAAQFRAMEEKLRSKKGKAPSGKKPADSLTTSNKEGVTYPIYQISKDGYLEPVSDGKQRVSFVAPDYGQMINASDRARQNEAIKIINEKGKEEFVPSISIFLLTDKGSIETPFGNGTFLQIPREVITDEHWNEYAQPLSGRDEWEGYNRSKQRAAKKEPMFDLSDKGSSEGPMVISTKKGKSFGEMLRGRLS
jgi:hypothetical protein